MPRPFRLVALLALLGSSAAQVAASEHEISLGLTSGLTTRSVYRGVVRSDSAWQAAVDGDIGPWRGSFWSTRPFDSAAPGELSSALGYVRKLDDDFTVEAWGTHFWYVDQPRLGAPSHSFEADLQLTWAPQPGWRLGLLSGYDIRYRSTSLQGAIDYDLALERWGTFLQLRAYVGYVTGKDLLPDSASSRVADDYLYGGADARLPFHLSFHTSVSFEAHFTSTGNQARTWSPLGVGAGSREWFTVSIRYDY